MLDEDVFDVVEPTERHREVQTVDMNRRSPPPLPHNLCCKF